VIDQAQKIRPLSIRSQAVERLREAILSGELKPGDRLVERQLGEQLGISQVSVREALQQLEHEGLVSKKANTGTFVTELTMQKFREILEVRLQLEPFVVRQASRRLTAERERELQQLVDEINRGIARRDYYVVSRTDFRFHQKIWKIGGNETMARILTQTCNPYYSFILILTGLPQEELRERFSSEPALLEYFEQDLEARYQSHQVLLDIIKRGEPEEIDRATRDHILVTWSSLLNRS